MSTTKDTFPDTETADHEYITVAEAILDDLRSRNDEIPQWEFCEGFMAALIVCRQKIDTATYLNILLDMEFSSAPDCDFHAPFVSAEQQQQFMEVWQRRWSEIDSELGKDIDMLGEDGTHHPLVVDVAGLVQHLSEADRAALAGQTMPSYAQVWALGFMYMVENWPEEWVPPRDKEQRKTLESVMQSIVSLTEYDTDPPTISVYDDAAPPTVSQARMEVFVAALWGVYALYALFRELGPRVETVYSDPKPGRNNPCHCGSGKKYKKCHGA